MPNYTLFGKEVNIDIDQKVFPTDTEFKTREDMFVNCIHEWFPSPTSGNQLHYRICCPSSIKGVVVFLHGIQAQSGRGFVLRNGQKVAMPYLADTLMEAGYAWYGIDLQGHGYSEGKRFYVPRWTDNRDDMEAFAKMVALKHPDVPFFVMGESYGGTLALHIANMWEDKEKCPPNFKGILLAAPAIIADLPPAPVVYTLRYILAPLFPTMVPFFMPNPVSAERIWSDEEVRAHFTDQRFYEMNLEGCGRAFRLGTAVNLLIAVESVRKSVVPKITIPFVVCHGTQDMAILMKGTNYLMEHAQTPEHDRTVLLQEGAYHDLFSEPKRDDCMAVYIQFLNEQCAKK